MRSNKTEGAFVYVLTCGDGSLYTGWTDDLPRRLASHGRGRASKYTRSRLPVRLLAWLAFEDAAAARSFEAHFKQLTRREKLAAIEARQAFGMRVHKAPAATLEEYGAYAPSALRELLCLP